MDQISPVTVWQLLDADAFKPWGRGSWMWPGDAWFYEPSHQAAGEGSSVRVSILGESAVFSDRQTRRKTPPGMLCHFSIATRALAELMIAPPDRTRARVFLVT